MERTDELRSMVLLALADGSFAPEERALLQERAKTWGISNEEYRAIVEQEESLDVQLTIPPTIDERRKLLADFAEVIAADGKFTTLEKNLFAVAAVRMEVGEDDLEAILAELPREEKT